jgi:hypothetical protein
LAMADVILDASKSTIRSLRFLIVVNMSAPYHA